MPTLTLTDGATLFYKDWGAGQPIVFSHGWPLSADAWDGQMLALGKKGFRVIAHDRRGHGRSSQTWDGNQMDRYADDLAELITALDLRDAVLVGHSTGGGEIARYVGRHGTCRLAGLVLVGAVPPIMVSTPEWPDGLPVEAFDEIRAGVAGNRSAFFRELPEKFYNFNRTGTERDEGLVAAFWLQGMMGSIKGQYDCIHEFSEVDYTPDLRAIDVPTLIVHGDDDQIVPIAHSAELSARIIPGATLTVYEVGSHGLVHTHQARFTEDLLAFLAKVPAGARNPAAQGA